MLLYMASNQNVGLFDFLVKKQGIIVKKLSGEFYMKKFIIHDMRNLSHYSFIAIDLSALKDTEDEIMEAVLAFKSMYYSRLIIFAEGMQYSNPLVSRLVEEGIYNIITATEIEEIKSEITMCVSDEGMDYHDIIKVSETENLTPKYLFKEENITIGVAGVLSRIGTTTTAMNLANYLASIGAKVSYIEANANNHLNSLPDVYKGMKVEDDCIRYKGVNYMTIKSGNKENNNFSVFDFGVLNDGNLKALKYSKIVIICGGGKPYELKALHNAIMKLKELSINIILSFIPERGRVSLKNELQSENIIVHFTDYSPDIFDCSVNNRIWKDILNEYIFERIT